MRSGSGPTVLNNRTLATTALILVAGCATMPFGGGRSSDQMTAAITDVREGTTDRLVLSTERLAPFRVAPDGASEPEVRTQGEHTSGWVESLQTEDVVDDVCSSGASCRPQAGALLVRLSTPYDGRTGVFVDATIQSVVGSEAGADIIQTRFVRFQIEDEAAGWRVVASTPLWESVG